MGVDMGDEARELEEIRSLSREARGHIGHHLRNSLQAIVLFAEIGDKEGIKKGINHIIADLKRMGC